MFVIKKFISIVDNVNTLQLSPSPLIIKIIARIDITSHLYLIQLYQTNMHI